MKQKIRKWLRKKGYKLEASNYDQYDPDEKTIYYNKRLSKKNKLYTILHECGHLLVQQNIFSYEKRHKCQVEGLQDARKRRSLRWRIGFLKEEYAAWDRGFRLAKRLKIPIDEDCYYNYASKCLASYCRWAIDKEWHQYDY